MSKIVLSGAAIKSLKTQLASLERPHRQPAKIDYHKRKIKEHEEGLRYHKKCLKELRKKDREASKDDPLAQSIRKILEASEPYLHVKSGEERNNLKESIKLLLSDGKRRTVREIYDAVGAANLFRNRIQNFKHFLVRMGDGVSQINEPGTGGVSFFGLIDKQ